MAIAQSLVRRGLVGLFVIPFIILLASLPIVIEASAESSSPTPIYAVKPVVTPDIYLPITAKLGSFSELFRSTPLAEPTVTISPAETTQQPMPTSSMTVAATSTPTSPPAPAPTSTDRSSTTEKERIVAEKLNEQRMANGIPTAVTQDQLVVAARRHSLDMATVGHTSHTGSDGSEGGVRIADAGYIWRGWGEVLAWGYDTAYDELITDWMNSSAHRAVILEPFFQDVGIGQISEPDSPYQHYWTVDYGMRMTEQALAASYPYICTLEIGSEERGSVMRMRSATPCEK